MANIGDYKLSGGVVTGFDGTEWVEVSGAVVSQDDADKTVVVRVDDTAVPAPTGVLEVTDLAVFGFTGFVSVTAGLTQGGPAAPQESGGE